MLLRPLFMAIALDFSDANDGNENAVPFIEKKERYDIDIDTDSSSSKLE